MDSVFTAWSTVDSSQLFIFKCEAKGWNCFEVRILFEALSVVDQCSMIFCQK